MLLMQLKLQICEQQSGWFHLFHVYILVVCPAHLQHVFTWHVSCVKSVPLFVHWSVLRNMLGHVDLWHMFSVTHKVLQAFTYFLSKQLFHNNPVPARLSLRRALIYPSPCVPFIYKRLTHIGQTSVPRFNQMVNGEDAQWGAWKCLTVVSGFWILWLANRSRLLKRRKNLKWSPVEPFTWMQSMISRGGFREDREFVFGDEPKQHEELRDYMVVWKHGNAPSKGWTRVHQAGLWLELYLNLKIIFMVF